MLGSRVTLMKINGDEVRFELIAIRTLWIIHLFDPVSTRLEEFALGIEIKTGKVVFLGLQKRSFVELIIEMRPIKSTVNSFCLRLERVMQETLNLSIQAHLKWRMVFYLPLKFITLLEVWAQSWGWGKLSQDLSIWCLVLNLWVLKYKFLGCESCPLN